MRKKRFVPCTPAGAVLMSLAAATEDQAIANIMVDLAPRYKSWKEAKDRGYEILKIEAPKP